MEEKQTIKKAIKKVAKKIPTLKSLIAKTDFFR